MHHAQCLLADGFHGAQKRGLFVECFAAIGAKCRRDAQGAILDECIGRGIPRGIAARLKRRAQAARREGRCVRLAAHQLLAGKFHDDAAVRRGRNEAVVLFGGDAGERLEPVGIVRCPLFERPVLHRIGDHTRDGGVKVLAERHGAAQRLIGVLRQPLPHDTVVEHHRPEKLRYLLHEKIHSFFHNKNKRCEAKPHSAVALKYPNSIAKRGKFVKSYRKRLHCRKKYSILNIVSSVFGNAMKNTAKRTKG